MGSGRTMGDGESAEESEDAEELEGEIRGGGGIGKRIGGEV